jgi:murein L,D-transpeptidase YcbB/YkuD
MYLEGSQTPNITGNNSTRSEALENCKTNHNANPTSKIRCTWGTEEIYTFIPAPTTTAGVPGTIGSMASSYQSQADFSYVWTRDLQIGSPFTEDVVALQIALAKEGVYSGDPSGGFYSQTFAAVKAFQQKYGIEATGFVGPETRAKLNALF